MSGKHNNKSGISRNRKKRLIKAVQIVILMLVVLAMIAGMAITFLGQ